VLLPLRWDSFLPDSDPHNVRRNTVEKEGAGEAPERAARRAAKGSSQRGPELIPPRQKGQFPGAGASIRPG
jgi:hypothetical protein